MKNIANVRQLVAERLNVDENAFAETSVCVFPHFVDPQQPYTLGWILQALGIQPRAYSPWVLYDYLICFEDQTRSLVDVREFVNRSASRWMYRPRDNEWLEGIPQVKAFINADCMDISKQKVGRVFEEVFGYSLDVDPREVTGKIVRKSDTNAAHDGEIVLAPISNEDFERGRDQFVYNVVVNNVDGDFIDDLRVTWCGHVCPLIDRKRRAVKSRFGHGGEVFIEPATTHFTPENLERIGEFCVKFGLDYGELDVLKDRDSKRIYIVDVNKTPNRPLGRMDESYAETALVNLAVEFARGLLTPDVARAVSRRAAR